MREQLIKYVELLFAGTPDAEDMKQEILQNTLDRYDDLIEQGKSPEAAYRLAISGIGDLSELLGGGDRAPVTVSTPEKKTAAETPGASAKKKGLRAIAIAMYICCVIPVIILDPLGFETIGICLMFMLIAIATALIIFSSNGTQEPKQEKTPTNEPKTELGKAIKSVSGIVTLCIYLGISFYTGAWHITWLVFPISGAIEGLVKAIVDLKEANKYET